MTERPEVIQVLLTSELCAVPMRAQPNCRCPAEILVIVRKYGGGEHLWLECGTCYQRGKQAVSKDILKSCERRSLKKDAQNAPQRASDIAAVVERAVVKTHLRDV